MYDYTVIGGGIESFLIAFLILSKNPSLKVRMITKSSKDFASYSSISKVSVRHFSKFDFNNVILESNYKLFDKTTLNGGWNTFSEQLEDCEAIWLKNRLANLSLKHRENIVNRKLSNLASKSNRKWLSFFCENKELAQNVGLRKRVYKFTNRRFCSEADPEKSHNIESLKINKALHCSSDCDYNAFSLDVRLLCRRILDHPVMKNLEIEYDTEIDNITFTNGRIAKIIASSGESFSSRNYFFSVGVQSENLNRVLDLEGKLTSVLGLWFCIEDLKVEHPFKYYHYDRKGYLQSCHSFTPVQKIGESFIFDSSCSNAVIVGSGCAWAGYGRTKIDNQCKAKFISNQLEVLKYLFPHKKISLIADDCYRSFSYTGLPLICRHQTTNDGYAISLSGSGTFTASASIQNVQRCIDLFK